MTAQTKQFSGIGVSAGYAIGYIHIIKRENHKIPLRNISSSETDREVERFERAIERSLASLDQILEQLESSHSEGHLIVEAHRMMMRDELLEGRTKEIIRSQQINAEAALQSTLNGLNEAFLNMKDGYFQERGDELRFVGQRIMACLTDQNTQTIKEIPQGAIVLSRELSPADALEFTAMRIGGLVTELGGRTSHTAIMTRAMEIPAILGAKDVLDHVTGGELAVLDGTSGVLVVNPDKETVQNYREQRRLHQAWATKLLANRDRPAVTTDGVQVNLEGNIEYLEEIENLISRGGEGIGLFRTEFLFMTPPLPNEELQVAEYQRILEEVSPHPVTMRTLDPGGDKIATFTGRPRAENPALGLRGVRLTLKEHHILKTQLRALLRASAHGNLRLLIPFVTGLSDIRQVKEILEEVKGELTKEGRPFIDNLSIGCMVELPSAALIADLLAKEVDFFSIGTNDLVQYTLAVDRDNEAVADLFTPLHPAIIRLLDHITKAAKKADLDVSICGEMAGEPLNIPLLIGCGLTRFSMNPVSIPVVKDLICRTSAKDCKELLEEVKSLPTHEEIRDRIMSFLLTLNQDT